MSRIPTPTLLGRNVYIAPFLSERGHPVLMVLDSRHRLIRQTEITPNMDTAEELRLLRGLLDWLDPPASPIVS